VRAVSSPRGSYVAISLVVHLCYFYVLTLPSSSARRRRRRSLVHYTDSFSEVFLGFLIGMSMVFGFFAGVLYVTEPL
jgi:hypothetical protein